MNKQPFITPLLVPLVGLIGGIYTQFYLPQTPISLVSTLIISLLFFLVLKKDVNPKNLVFFCFFLAGNFLLYTAQKKQGELITFLSKAPIDVTGTIVDEERKSDTWCPYFYNFYVTQVTNQNQESFTLFLYCNRKLSVEVGDTCTFKNLKLCANKETSKLNNSPTFETYLAKENCLSSLFLTSPEVILLKRPLYSPTRFLIKKRNSLLRTIQRKLSKKSFTLFSSIFLGLKQFKAADQTKEAFSFWGLAHYLARSGLHIVLLIFSWTLFLQFLPISRTKKRLLLLLLTLIYTLFSWSSISYMRAVIVFALYEIGNLLKKTVNFLHLLTITCMGILLMNPHQLFFLDFQLTFALTFALVLTPLLLPK